MRSAKEKRSYLSQEDIPAFSLEEALRIPQAIFENFGKQNPTPLKVAGVLQLAPQNAQFKMLCGAAIAYGFTSGGYNAASISIEPLAKRILAPTIEGDDLVAKREAFMRPRVNREFVQSYSNSPLPKEDIGANVLVEMGVPRERAAMVFQSITGTADKLGMLQDIKGKKYVSFTAEATPSDEEESAPEKEIANGGPSPAVTIIPSATVKPSNSSNVATTSTLPIINVPTNNRRVFITHGKNKAFVEPIKKLLHFGELEAVVSVDQQSVSQPVPDKVMNDMRSCGAAIIHVCGELKLMDSEAKEHVILNPNVLIEIGAAIALYGRRFILLVKEGVRLPSNLQGLYEVRYAGETLDGDVTIRLMEAINALKTTLPITKFLAETN